MNGPNKLKVFSLAGFSILAKCLQVRPEPTQVKHLLGAPLYSRLQALPTKAPEVYLFYDSW